jgi:hypothetical protein
MHVWERGDDSLDYVCIHVGVMQGCSPCMASTCLQAGGKGHRVRVHARGKAPKGSTPEGGRRKGPRQREGAERVRARGSVCQKGDSGPLDDMGMKDEEGGTREGRGDGG